jgi:plasmid stabilization system protein ParE
MAYRLVIRDMAAAEAVRARDWYEKARVGLGKRFHEAVSIALDDVQAAPAKFRLRTGSYRHAPVIGFPYAVIYRMDGRTVVVVSIFHLKRKPRSRFK